MTSTDGRKSSTGKSHKPPAPHPWRQASFEQAKRRKARLEALRKAKDGERTN